jgi:class 3 adenylate cyclase
MRRKLTAIVAADMVSYTRLISEDERAVLGALDMLRTRFFQPFAEKHGGRIFRLLGDGIMLEFESALGAVEFAVETQTGLARHSAENPQQLPLVLRIGINLGDAVIDKDDLHGEGVTIAVRIESLSEPGGICLTDAVHTQVKHRLGTEFVSIGPRSLKSIADPVHLWRWRPTGERSQSRPFNPRGQHMLDPRLLNLVLSLHARSMMLAVSNALDAVARENGEATPFEAFFSRVTEQLANARQLLCAVKIERAANDDEPSMNGVQQTLSEFVRTTFHHPRIGYASKVLPETQAILASSDPYLVKRTRMLELIQRHHNEAFIAQAQTLIDHAYIE